MKSGKWSVQTRWLHIGLAVTVTLQLAISLIMEPPDKETATALARAAFEAHEVVGMSALAIVLMHWFWSVVGRAGPWEQMRETALGAAWARVKGDIGLLIRGRLPDDGPRGGLPGFVHFGDRFHRITGLAGFGKDEKQHSAGDDHAGDCEQAEAVHEPRQAAARSVVRQPASYQQTDIPFDPCPRRAGPWEQMRETALGAADDAPEPVHQYDGERGHAHYFVRLEGGARERRGGFLIRRRHDQTDSKLQRHRHCQADV